MQTDPACVLWVNLCADTRNAQDLNNINQLNTCFTIRPVDKDKIPDSVQDQCPHIICLDYDFPDRHSLLLLRQLRCDYPSIPIIMVTTQHCENLAVWAFRTGVRDYLVKPLPVDTLVEILNILCSLKRPVIQSHLAPRKNLLPPPLLPDEFRHKVLPLQTNRTILAICYIETHFNETISEKYLADLCGMNIYVFSKVFRREQSMTFREFLLRIRIERAKDLLRNPVLTSTEIAGLVGFSDASSFARLFRRYVGQTPTLYRRHCGS